MTRPHPAAGPAAAIRRAGVHRDRPPRGGQSRCTPRRTVARVRDPVRSFGSQSDLVTLNPPHQYADDRNLSARQRLWQCRIPPFDAAAWVLDLAGVVAGSRVLDAGCGNGLYLRALRVRRASVVGCDLSPGMLRAIARSGDLINADVTALPIRDGAVDVVIAAQLLDLVPDRGAAVRELRRVLAPSGTCIVVTTGAQHLRSLRALAEQAAQVRTPGWRMDPPTGTAFTAQNAAAQLGLAFRQVTWVSAAAAGPVVIKDASVAEDYVNSLADHYQSQVAEPWQDIARQVGSRVQAVIASEGEFRTAGDTVAFVCR